MKKTTTNETYYFGYSSVQSAIAIYGADVEKCNMDLLKNSTENLGQFLFIKTETSIAKYNKSIAALAKKMQDEDLTEVEKAELQGDIDKLEAEKAIIEPIHDDLKLACFDENINPEVAIYAYGADKATTLHLDNLDELKAYATKIRNLGHNHYVHVKSLADTKKGQDASVYKELKRTMQGMLNAMLPERNYHINGEAVFAMCNILVGLSQSTDKNFGMKSGMKYAKIDTVIRQMCKIANLCIAKRMEALKVKEVQEKTKVTVAITKDSEQPKDMENQPVEVAEVATAE